MNRILCLLLVFATLLSFTACGMGAPEDEGLTDEEYYQTVVNGMKEAEICAILPEYVPQRGAPDLLTASVKNNSGKTLTRLYLAFAAWDAEGNPVLLKDDDLQDDMGKYVDAVRSDPILLQNGSTWEGNEGYGLGDDCEIHTFRVIAQGYEASDGTKWENPHYAAWCDIFEGKPLQSYMTEDEVGQKPDPKVAYEAMVAKAEAQPIFADSPVYLTQPLEDDLIFAKVYNRSQVTIKKFYLAYTAFDQDGNALKMKSASGTEYVKLANFTDDITIAPGETWEKEVGLPIEDNTDIVYIKVLAAAYEDENGTKWESPVYADWKYFLEDVTLEDYQKSEKDKAEQR
ncbi:MAG: hypothetical protein IJC84_03300 [Clostridia bacterium]|nr:hypothetical protein [Clostridia bacterium]